MNTKVACPSGSYILVHIREVLLRRSSLELCLNLGKVLYGNDRLFFIVLLRKVNLTYISNTLQPGLPSALDSLRHLCVNKLVNKGFYDRRI